MHWLTLLFWGLVLGAVSWLISPMLSGQFEPFDSGLALTVGQVLMSAYGAYVGFRCGIWKLVVAVAGLYLGQMTYWYLFGGAEARAWVLIGALTTWLLCAFPGIAGILGVGFGYWQRVRAQQG